MVIGGGLGSVHGGGPVEMVRPVGHLGGGVVPVLGAARALDLMQMDQVTEHTALVLVKAPGPDHVLPIIPVQE